jgi:hypothetical protein
VGNFHIIKWSNNFLFSRKKKSCMCIRSRKNMTKFLKLVYAMILLLFIFLVVTNAMNASKPIFLFLFNLFFTLLVHNLSSPLSNTLLILNILHPIILSNYFWHWLSIQVNGVFLLKSLCAICMGVTVGHGKNLFTNLEGKW